MSKIRLNKLVMSKNYYFIYSFEIHYFECYNFFGDLIYMFLFIEFFFYIIFISHKLYSLLDRYLLYTSQGGKIDRYIKKYDLKNLTCNFENTLKNNFLFFFKSPNSSKYIINIVFATIVSLILKIAFTCDFFFSKFYIVKFLNKDINLKYIFGSKYYIFKIIYYVSFTIFVLIVFSKITFKVISRKKVKKEGVIKYENMLTVGTFSDRKVGIKKKGLYQNILITGSIGSGKTSTAIYSILSYFIKNKIPGLILDVKGNYLSTLKNIIDSNNVDVKLNVISEDEGLYNPIDLEDIKPYELASRIRKVLTILSEKSTSDSYWLDKAEAYIKDFIILIRTYNDYVSFKEIHNLCVDDSYLLDKIKKVKEIAVSGNLDEGNLFEITNTISNLNNEYLKLDDRTRNIIRSEITRMTDVFVSDYNISKRFCMKNPKKFSFKDSITLVSMNIGKNPKLAKIIATYIKLNFQSEVLKSSDYYDIFMVCDEYQEFCNEEDAHFFSLSREYKCINVIAMQSYTSLKNSLNNENAAKVIIQNFVNKIWFRQDDCFTIEEIIKQLGSKEKKRTNISISESSQDSKYDLINKKFKNMKSGISQSYTITENLEHILDSNYFSNELKTFQAVCLFSDGINYDLYKKVQMNMWKEGKINE